MANGLSLSLAEIKQGSAELVKLVAPKTPLGRKRQRVIQRNVLGPRGYMAGRRHSSAPTGAGSLTRIRVQVSETPGISPLYFPAAPFPCRRPMDWAAHKAMQRVTIVPDKPAAETLPYGERRRHYQAQMGERPLTLRQRKRLRQKQNVAGKAQRVQTFGARAA